MTDSVVLCKDCAQFSAKDKRCLAAPRGIDLVTGEDLGYWYAVVERTSNVDNACGKPGRKFVPIEVVYGMHEARMGEAA